MLEERERRGKERKWGKLGKEKNIRKREREEY